MEILLRDFQQVLTICFNKFNSNSDKISKTQRQINKYSNSFVRMLDMLINKKNSTGCEKNLKNFEKVLGKLYQKKFKKFLKKI